MYKNAVQVSYKFKRNVYLSAIIVFTESAAKRRNVFVAQDFMGILATPSVIHIDGVPIVAIFVTANGGLAIL